jgi:hypothetical protein
MLKGRAIIALPFHLLQSILMKRRKAIGVTHQPFQGGFLTPSIMNDIHKINLDIFTS